MKPIRFGLALLATLVSSAFGQDTIAPTTFTATIGVGGTAQVKKIVTVGQQSGVPVDILFLVDATGSMGPAIAAVRDGFASTVTAVNGFASNVQFGVANYLDSFTCPGDPYAFQLTQNLTSNTALVQAALNNVAQIPVNTPSLGCDEPESGIFGLQSAAASTSWRAGSKRIIVWVGDAPSHDPAGPSTEATAIAALTLNNVEVIAASANSGFGLDAPCLSAPCAAAPKNSNLAVRVTAATGGVDLGQFSPAGILTAVENAIATALQSYSSVCLSVPSLPAGVTVTITPPCITGSFSRATTSTFNFNVTFTGTAPGVYPFPINALIDGGIAATEQDIITVEPPLGQPPSVSKVFAPPSITTGGTSVLTFAISNLNSTPVTGVGLNDPLPAGLVVASPNGLTGSCGGGAITATPGSGSITLTGATLPVAGCTFSVNVAATTDGPKVNLTDTLTSAAGVGNRATATLNVVTIPTITKTFSSALITVGGTAGLTLTIRNPNTVVALTGLAVSDTLPAGLRVATPNGLTTNCNGTVTAVAGSNLISVTGVSLAPGATCAVTASVTATGSPVGTLVNTTSTLTSDQAPPGAPGTATITVGDPYMVSYAANLDRGDSFVNITNTGASGAGLGFGTSAAVTGALCANVYVYDALEEIVSCCSCPVTPNGLVSLSAQRDLISNPLTRAPLTSVVIKILTTVPVAGSCMNSALLAGSTLASGLVAWNTTIHRTNSDAARFAVTENRFATSTLSTAELTRLAYGCSVVANVGSGFGICGGCRLGGLGADRQ